MLCKISWESCWRVNVERKRYRIHGLVSWLLNIVVLRCFSRNVLCPVADLEMK